MNDAAYSMALFQLADDCSDLLVETDALKEYVVDLEKTRLEALLFGLEVVRMVFAPDFEKHQDRQKIDQTHKILVAKSCTDKEYRMSQADERREMHRSTIRQLLRDENHLGAKSAFHIYHAPLEEEQNLNYILNQNKEMRLYLISRIAFTEVVSMVREAKEAMEAERQNGNI